MFRLSKRITEWTRGNVYTAVEIQNYISIVGAYFSNLSTICDFPELPSAQLPLTPHPWQRNPEIVASFIQELKAMFVVPRLNKFHQTQNRVKKSHLLQAFLSLLLHLISYKSYPIVGPVQDPIDILEKELRSLLIILGDISWMPCSSHEYDAEFQDLLREFEAAANQAGILVYYFIFSAERAIGELDEGLAAVLKHTDLLKAKLQLCVGIPADTTSMIFIVDSILIVNSLVDDLEDLLKREDDQIANVKDQVNLLHQELLLLNSSMNEMRSPQPSEIEEIKEPLMCAGGIAHQAEYLVTSFFIKDAPLWYVLKRLTDLNQKIGLIRMELQVITQKYQFGGLKVVEYIRAELPLHDKRVNDVTVGFEDKITEILYQLVGGGSESLQLISIFGMPGLGKTTLANKLYNHPSVNDRFDKLAWSVVSQTCKTPSILANILIHINSELGKDNILDTEEIRLVEHIHKTLMGRRYLIVLDDVWDSNVLDKLVRCFPDDGNGSRILLTNRIKDVAPPNSIIHELPFLSDEQCWELLEKKVFGSRSCPPQLQGIGKKIAARCCGLPLTVVVIAGVLSTMDEEESRWEKVGGNLASYIDAEDSSVMRILELSYKHLPDNLKPCFLYFGEFKEDEAISVQTLKRLWVAEGFICKEKDKSVENIAEEYLMELVDKSLVMVAKRRKDGRGAKTYFIHDLLRDLCREKSKEESFLKYLNSDYLHTVYEKDHCVRANGFDGTLRYCQHVRSFVGYCLSGSFYVRDMRLKVLHFNYIDREHIFGIEYLVNLKYLVINDLPTRIGKLVNLEFLRVELGVGVGVNLPPTIGKMKKLRYLRSAVAEYDRDWAISNQTNNLEYLSMYIIRKLKDEQLLKCSPHLRRLKCKYSVSMDHWTCPHFDLGFLTQLDSLSLHGVLSEKRDFGFPSNIRKLTLQWTRLPWEKMSIVGRLEFLEVLKLRRDAFVGERWDTRDGEFQNLMFLQLGELLLSEWNVASNEHLPKLQQLILSYCENLEEIPSEIGEITTLELIKVHRHCLPSLVESAERIKEEQLDMGNENLRVIISATDIL